MSDVSDMKENKNPQGNSQYKYEDIIEYLRKNGELNIFLQEYNKIMQEEDKYYFSLVHGIDHISRVTFLATILASIDDLSEHDKSLLLVAARYHDIGRRNDREDKEHGSLSVEKIHEFNLLSEYSEDDRQIIEFSIKHHSLSRQENEVALENIPENKREKYRLILSYLKDADALDRVRIVNRSMQLDPKRLRCETARKMIDFAYINFNNFSSFIQECKVTSNRLTSDKETNLQGNIGKTQLIDVPYEQYNPDSIGREFEKTGELEKYYSELRKIVQDKSLYYLSNENGIYHTAKVTMFAMFLAKLDNLSEQDKKLLLLAARYHNIGKYDDKENANYGEWSVKKIEDGNLLEGLSREEIRIIKFAIKEYANPISENIKSLRRVPFWKRQRYKLILNYLKDAETLDTVGDIEDNVQEILPKLISETSKKLISFAYKVNRTFFKGNKPKSSEKKKEANPDLLRGKDDALEYMEVTGGIKYISDVLNTLKKDATLDSDNFAQLDEALKNAFWVINIATLEDFSHEDINILLTSIIYDAVHNSDSGLPNKNVSINQRNREYEFLEAYSAEDKQLIKFLVEQYKQSDEVNREELSDVVFFRRKKYVVYV